MARTIPGESGSGRRKLVEAVGKAIRPRTPASHSTSNSARNSQSTAEGSAEESRRDAELYDHVDRRLMDTFPASDAVARY